MYNGSYWTKYIDATNIWKIRDTPRIIWVNPEALFQND